MAAVTSVPESLEILKSSIEASAADAGNRNFGGGLLGGILISGAVLMVSQKKMPSLPKGEDVDIYALCSIFVAIGTLGFYFIDGQETLVDSFYCSCITLSTVGYGDICPKSDGVAIKAFISVFALCGLGLFCNHLLDRTTSWKDYLKTQAVEDGFQAFSVLLVVIGLSACLFMSLEGWSFADASYFSIVTGTTIGYGDHPPFTTAEGKIAAAVFAMLSIEAVSLVTTVMKRVVSEALEFATPGCQGECQWKGVLAFAAGLVLVGTIGFVVLDGQDSVVDAFYCSCITVSTVGYGDICPISGTITMKVFVVVLALGGLGIFSEFLDLSQKWKDYIPVHQAIGSLAACVVASIVLFTTLEGWSIIDAAYFSIITGTTIGYGDLKPETSLGKIATAVFALLSINVVGSVTTEVGDNIRKSVANFWEQDQKEKPHQD